uniref:Putative reverse transcriptase domain-containing protein n=1 Tax=Tanacetum cinerariifolium TaxID=118510 RepID=A0A6L2KAD7_TANCI|nr:putative reverse transcriptase domain-containing protein [Tanacetum cinerariifolium]
MKYIYFEFTVMPFGLTNGPAEHEVHLKLILELLEKEKLFAKFLKCDFWLQEFRFLGHVVNNEGPDDFVAYCDASNQGFGCVLTQRNKGFAAALAVLITKASQSKKHGVVMQEPSETLTTTTIPISLKVQDKEKGIMVKESLKMKKKDQLSFDEQEARRLQAKIDKKDRLAKEKAQQIEDENLLGIMFKL